MNAQPPIVGSGFLVPLFILLVGSNKDYSSGAFRRLLKANPVLAGFLDEKWLAMLEVTRLFEDFELLDFLPDYFLYRLVEFFILPVPIFCKLQFEQGESLETMLRLDLSL